jgi:hypothetical protein
MVLRVKLDADELPPELPRRDQWARTNETLRFHT